MAAKRRPLEFSTIDEAVAEIDRLRTTGYTKRGNGSLGQICQHCAIMVRGSLEGMPTEKPPLLLRLLGPWMVWWMIRSKRMAEGIHVPEHLLPKPTVDEDSEIDLFKGLLIRFRDHQGELFPSPFAGKLTREKWTRLNLLHAAHHLSFFGT